MIVYPAIDIRGGRIVRLVKGDFARQTTYDQSPADAARRWSDLGAEWLHVVDLDATLAGEPVNTDAVRAILEAIAVPVQLGGGMRSIAAVERAFEIGVERVVVGTKAVADPSFVESLIARWGERIAAGLDAREGKLATCGWLEQTDVSVIELTDRLIEAGAAHLIYTDIDKDGALTGPNLQALRELVKLAGDRVIASGGASTLTDVEAIRDAGAGGVIIGRALYDGRIDFAEAIRVASSIGVAR